MSKYQLETICYTKDWDHLKLNEKKMEMTEMLGLLMRIL